MESSVSSGQSLSCVRLFAIPWTAACQASLSITNSQSLLKLMSIKLVMPSNHLILSCPLLLLPLIFPSIRVFSNESVLCIRWPKYWSFSFSISIRPSSKYSGLISFRMVGSPCSPRDSQESSPTSQFKSINSSVLSFLHSPTLTSIHDHWEKQQSTGMSCSWLRRDQPFRFSIVQYRWKTDFMWRGVNSMKILNDCSYHTLGSTLVS